MNFLTRLLPSRRSSLKKVMVYKLGETPTEQEAHNAIRTAFALAKPDHTALWLAKRDVDRTGSIPCLLLYGCGQSLDGTEQHALRASPHACDSGCATVQTNDGDRYKVVFLIYRNSVPVDIPKTCCLCGKTARYHVIADPLGELTGKDVCGECRKLQPGTVAQEVAGLLAIK